MGDAAAGRGWNLVTLGAAAGGAGMGGAGEVKSFFGWVIKIRR